MRLLRTDKLEVIEFQGQDIPPYAILSHTWAKEEVSLQDVQQGLAKSRLGYDKIAGACAVAIKDGFEYIWIDTCCIDKSSSAELSEAINSMFKWYGGAEVCYAFLSDVSATEDPHKPRSGFRMSRWFTRGWTLQELIAPGVVHFYDTDWEFIGCREKLLNVIVEVTKISPTYFATGDVSQFSAAQKMSWAAYRETTRPEDIAYCLLGLFDINMPLLYGEGERALQRLQEEILRQSEDDSLFCHDGTEMLAISPLYFRDASKVLKGETWPYKNNPGLVLNRNLSLNRNRITMSFPVAQVSPHEFFKFCALSPTLPPKMFPELQPQKSIHLALLNCGMSESASVLILREDSPGVFIKQGVPCSPIAQAALDPKLAERLTNTTLFISLAVTNPSTRAWDWKARNDPLLPEGMLQGQLQVHFQTRYGWEPTMTPIIRPAISYNRSDDALNKLCDKVVVKGPCRDTSGFRFQFIHAAYAWLAWVEHGDEIHLLPHGGGAEGQLWLIFSSSTDESFMVTLKPTRASANAQLYTNIPAWKGKPTIEYVQGFGKQSEAGNNKLSRYTEPQRLSSEDDARVQVQLDSRRQMNGWWVHITVTPIPGGNEGST